MGGAAVLLTCLSLLCLSLPAGRCGGCGDDVVGDGAGVVALDRVFHVGCFVCATCRAQLRGQHFYAVERKAYCENCYVVRGSGPSRGVGCTLVLWSLSTSVSLNEKAREGVGR